MKSGVVPSGKDKKRQSRTIRNRALLAAVPAFFIFTAAALALSAASRLQSSPAPLSGAEEALARSSWYGQYGHALYPWEDAPDLTRLAEGNASRNFAGSLHAGSAIVVDASSGAVLFEKNADAEIPPASMAKLVAMYVAFLEMDGGTLSLDDSFEPPRDSWAENIPPHSSLMFLGRGQRLDVDELLRGMAVVSGNDAAIALATLVSGSVPSFVARMNEETARLGLARTRFVEPSGLSERNQTTAREFADFTLRYVRTRPEALEKYHSIRSFTYPKPHNLPAPGAGSEIANQVLAGRVPVTQNATNPLLGTLPGCDGIKTGYIDESGYNLALTAKRGNTRFISITLGAKARNAEEGNRFRAEDGTALMEWAFSEWMTVEQSGETGYPVAVWGGAEPSLRAIPATNDALTLPRGDPGAIKAVARLSRGVTAPISVGDELGKVDYINESGEVAASVPLIADRNAPRAPLPLRLWDLAARETASIIWRER